MKKIHKLLKGERVVYKILGLRKKGRDYEPAFEVNVTIMDVLSGDMYRIKPVSGYGSRVVSIKNLFI